jgi:tetratricopeptide (TPR) repeat protein
MPENNKTEEFLQKLVPCIERGELEACVEEAARVAREMGIGAEELLDLSSNEEIDNRFAYVLTLTAAQGLKGEDKADAYVNAALSSSELGLKQKEEEYYKKALELDPKNPDACYNYAILLEELGRKNEAEEHYKKALELDPKNPDAYYNYAILLEELGRKNEAEEHYKKALELDPKNPDVHDNYAILLAKLGRKIEAEKYFRIAIDLDPKDARAHSNYANFLILNGRFSKAEKEIRIALHIEPNYPYALRTLGDILAYEDSFEEAIKEYQKALKNSASMKPFSISVIHNSLGWVYTQLKRYSKAKDEFKKALFLDPMNIKARRNLRKLGKVEVDQEISLNQIFLGIVLLLSLFVSYRLFWINRLDETTFTAQIIFLVASLIFILLFHQIKRFKAGTVEFEMSTEHRFVEAKSQPLEFER